ncbi:hypothetical protein BDN72DRAFT_569765 [Pluteus cervinus]|uniref:Uncharacterized protein n=1 Tax=Pluteus cervinus TaxID=181527 RepID=A0ACD3AWZ0_9AGAR|nr:hypothetical protein BDN72DRAFT_569765 [Pluteus cervinus]
MTSTTGKTLSLEIDFPAPWFKSKHGSFRLDDVSYPFDESNLTRLAGDAGYAKCVMFAQLRERHQLKVTYGKSSCQVGRSGSINIDQPLLHYYREVFLPVSNLNNHDEQPDDNSSSQPLSTANIPRDHIVHQSDAIIPLGDGYTVKVQVSRNEDVGGSRSEVYDDFPATAQFNREDSQEALPLYMTPRMLAFGPGSIIYMEDLLQPTRSSLSNAPRVLGTQVRLLAIPRRPYRLGAGGTIAEQRLANARRLLGDPTLDGTKKCIQRHQSNG